METFPGNNGVLSGENFFINLFTPTGITIKKGAGYEEFRCATQYDNGKRSLFVSNIGIYYLDRPVKEFASRYPKKGDPPISLPLKKVIDLENITQVDAVKEYNMLFVLSKSTLYVWPLNSIETGNLESCRDQEVKIQSDVDCYKVNNTGKRALICLATHGILSSSKLRLIEPRVGKKIEFKEIKKITLDQQALFISFLEENVLCIGSKFGELVSLNLTIGQKPKSILDFNDSIISKIMKKYRQKELKPRCAFKLQSGPILINYNKFSFYVDDYGRLLSKHGNRGLDLIFYWKSSPNAFSISYPYVFAFGENMLEFGHLETGEIGSSIISNPRWFKSSSEQMMYAFKEFDKVNIFDTFALADFSNVVETFSDAPPRTLAILPDNSQSSLVTLH